jgi:DNA-binding IclR family transcriptional regulator
MAVSSGVRTVDRVAAILGCFSEEDPYLSLSEISERLDLAKSTTHRLLKSMLANGFLTREPDSREYSLGYQFMYWASIVSRVFDLRDLARPVLEELNQVTGETAILTVLEDLWVVCVEKVESRKAVRLAMPIGQRRWPHAGASAKVLMAYMSSEDIEATITGMGLPRLMDKTITAPEALKAELRQVRERGFATSFEETDTGTMGVAAPVMDGGGQVVAGIGIACPISRCGRAEVPDLARLVSDAARKLSGQLGSR